MRPAMYIIDIAINFKSNIMIHYKDQIADAKSIMQVTMLAMKSGEEVSVTADGEDENEAIEAMEEAVSKKHLSLCDDN